MGKLQIYKASAGSGKTHLLTEFYLKLACEQPENFKHILAVTFTNKAADEMKGRILLKISDIILKGDKAEHASALKEHLKCNDKELIERARSVRKTILHNYSDFKVGTIDSFIQRIIRAFSFELNLNSGYEIEFDTDKVINDLTELLLNQIPEDPQLKAWLVQLIEDKMDEGAAWDIRNEIKELSKELFKEEYNKPKVNENVLDGDGIDKTQALQLLKRIKSEFERDMLKLSEEYLSVIQSHGIDPNQQGSVFKTLYNFFGKSVPGKNYEVKTLALRNSINGIENWYAKSAKKEVVLTVESVYPLLSSVVNRFFTLLNEKSELYYSALAILKQFYAFGIIDNTGAFLPDYRNDNNLLLISDITLLLKELIGKNDAPFIYEKAGNRFKHILIDEFQDTSRYQWQIFKPLFLNALSQSYNNLIVGDVKQSVYRWRNGDWKLLLHGVKDDIGEELTVDKGLDTNWRSKKNIVQFNNTVFKFLPEILQRLYNRLNSDIPDESHPQIAPEQPRKNTIIEAYESCLQKLPDKPGLEGGKVVVKFFDNSLTSDAYVDALAGHLPQTIDKLLKSGCYKPEDIGILVRRNEDAENTVRLINRFKKSDANALNYALISPKSLKLSESGAVKILAAAMKYIYEPSDRLNLAELLYYHNNTDETVDLNQLFASGLDQKQSGFLPKELFDKTVDTGGSLYDLCEQLIHIFDLTKNHDDFPYIRAFRELVYDQSFGKSSGLSEFIDYWEEKGRYSTIEFPESADAVRIMTIHKSKGLAFKVVFIPFADWSIDNANKGPMLWVNPQIPGLEAFGKVPVKYSASLEKTLFKEAYYEEKLMAYTDAINMLYVAFTRAKEELYVYTTDVKEANEPKTIGHALYKVCAANENIVPESISDTINPSEFYDNSSKEFCLDSNHLPGPLAESTDLLNMQTADYNLNTLSDNGFDWSKRLNIIYRSGDFFIESSKDIEEKVNHGILMHRIFSEIISPDDIEATIKNLVFEGVITENESNELKEKVLEVISRPSVADWFSHNYEVRNEEALLTLSGEIKIPDRVLINDEKIIVIDFKFGKKHDKYDEQLKEYSRLLELAYSRKPEAYLYFVEDDTVRKVV
jgi:ATP-dependent exoDNAse (exonuclease V) beta subunit